MSVVQPGASVDVPEIDDGLYAATVTAVKDVTLEQPDMFGNTEKVELTITFPDQDGVVQTLNPRVNRKWGEKANLFHIAIACGIDADPDQPFDTEELRNRRVNVLVETAEEGKWPRVVKWQRLKESKRSGSSAVSPKPSGTIITPEGEVDWDTFWKQVRAAGATRHSVAAVLEESGSHIDDLPNMDPVDVAGVLQDVLKRAE